MKRILGEYGMTVVYCVIILSILGFFISEFMNSSGSLNFAQHVPNPEEVQVEAGDNGVLDEYTQPVLTVKSGTVALNSTFNVNDFVVTATDENGTNLKDTSNISYRGTVDTTKRGSYNIEIILSTDKFVQTKYTTIIVD